MSDLLAAVKARVAEDRKKHSEYRIYEECGHSHDLEDEHAGILQIEDVGLVCEQGYLYSVCYGCDTDDGETNEWTDEGKWPCDAARYIGFAEARLAWIEKALGSETASYGTGWVQASDAESELRELAKRVTPRAM